MYRESVLGCAAFVFLMAGAGLAQSVHALPDAPSAVLMRERLSESAPITRVEPQILREERVLKFLPNPPRLTDLGSYSVPPRNDAERLSAIGHKLMPALPMPRQLRYQPSDSPDLLGRAKNAISRVLLAHDEQGRAQANGAYLLGAVVTSVIATAYQPYVRHDPGEVFGNFGSTIGGAAGVNLFHEFWPQLKQKLTSRIASRAAEVIGNSETSVRRR